MDERPTTPDRPADEPRPSEPRLSHRRADGCLVDRADAIDWGPTGAPDGPSTNPLGAIIRNLRLPRRARR